MEAILFSGYNFQLLLENENSAKVLGNGEPIKKPMNQFIGIAMVSGLKNYSTRSLNTL